MSVGEGPIGSGTRAARPYERLGAEPGSRLVVELRLGATVADAVGARVTKTFMFTDIVTSTDLWSIGCWAW